MSSNLLSTAALIMFGLASTGSAWECTSGQKTKTDPEKHICMGVESSDCTSLTCCENDATKCLALSVLQGTACLLAGKFHDSSKHGNAKGDDATANCCTSFATCAQAADGNSGFCPAGYKLKDDAANYKCTGDVASCSIKLLGEPVCCQRDTSTCSALSVLEAGACLFAGKYHDSSKHGNAKGDDATANCCTSFATCAQAADGNSGFCPAGYKLKDDAANYKCTGDVASCSMKLLGEPVCCQRDTSKCSALSVLEGTACLLAGKFHDSSKYGNAKGDDATANCCTEAATCASVSEDASGGRRASFPVMLAMLAMGASAARTFWFDDM